MKRICSMLLATLAAIAAGATQASVIQTFGAGSTVKTITNHADFELDNPLVNNYVEDGLIFSYLSSDPKGTASGNNNGCRYAGTRCYPLGVTAQLSPYFDGNYMGTGGSNAYVRIGRSDGSDFYRIEFAAASGYSSVYGYWATFNNGLQTGAGNFNGTNIVGLADATGFDEVRFYAFSKANQQQGWSLPDIDAVRVGVPEPGSMLLLGAGLLGLFGTRRRPRFIR